MKIIKESKISKARITEIDLPHGKISSPFFMPDATRAVLKNLGPDDTALLGIPAMVVNTFHLFLQPGSDLVARAGGVNKFMNYNHPLLSDSGGFQVFSLIHQSRDKKPMGKITDDGAVFKSPLNGSKHELNPEKSIQIQFDLGTDMIVAFDDCPPNASDEKTIKKAVLRTIDWANRSKKEYLKQIKKRKLDENALPKIFGVIQGGVIKEERKRCTDALVEIGFDGLGFGARPIDADGNFLEEILSYTADIIPKEYLKFGLGIGTPDDIVRCARMGWDMFDCVIPTREGRHGRLFFWENKVDSKFLISNFQSLNSNQIQNSKFKNFYNTINITRSEFTEDFSPINADSKLPELRNLSKAYLHHLFVIKEPLGQRLASLNNLEFYMDLMRKVREGIESGNL
jgi:queuine tRNA-ribosyltransferase